MDIPDYMAPIMGFKVMEFNGVGYERLTSPYRDKYEWYPKRSSKKADCRATTHAPISTGHKSPGETCHCGYYSWYTLERAQENASVFRTARPVCFQIVVLVEASGDVVLHQQGFRSEYMTVIAMHDGAYPLRSSLERIAKEWGVPFLHRGELMEKAAESGVLFEGEEVDWPPQQRY